MSKQSHLTSGFVGFIIGITSFAGLMALGNSNSEESKQATSAPAPAMVREQIPTTAPAQPDLRKQGPVYELLSNDNGTVWFKDNLAPGMKAFAIYKSEEVELNQFCANPHSAYFRLPDDLREELKRLNTSYKVFAVDRDNNKSKPKTIHTLDGVFLEKNPSEFY